MPRSARQPFDLDLAEALIVEQVADQPPRALGDHDLVSGGEGLQPGGEVRRFADHRLLLGGTRADQVAHYGEAGSQTNAHLQHLRRGHPANGVDDRKASPHRSLCIVFVGAWVTEIGQDTVTHVLRYKTVEPTNRLRDAPVVGADHVAQILGIEPRSKGCRADQIAEHYRELAAFGIGWRRCFARYLRLGDGGGLGA